MKVSAVIVTYANRYIFLEQVVRSCIQEGVNDILIVDNASAEESRLKIENLASETPCVQVFHLPENMGSSGGFKFGIKKVIEESNTDFLWLLDDDNVPQPGALKVLVNTFHIFNTIGQNPVLYSYRGEVWEDDFDAVHYGRIKNSVINGFCGFDFITSLRKKLKKKSNSITVNYPIIRTTLGPYGGLFVDLENIKKIGLPDESFFVYADDHDFTSRFEEKGIIQYLVFNSKLKDVDISIGSDGGYFKEKTSELKIYYGLRNTTFYYKRKVTNRIHYFFNKFVFFGMLYYSAIKSSFSSFKLVRRRLNLISRAISEGERGFLGKKFVD
jgi:GT2 family glycosyltransferase